VRIRVQSGAPNARLPCGCAPTTGGNCGRLGPGCARQAHAGGVLRSMSVVATVRVLDEPSGDSFERQADAVAALDTYHGSPRACSSADRASASGAEGRRFESCRARHNPLLSSAGRAVRVGCRGQPWPRGRPRQSRSPRGHAATLDSSFRQHPVLRGVAASAGLLTMGGHHPSLRRARKATRCSVRGQPVG
jgi:hypothetical protein